MRDLNIRSPCVSGIFYPNEKNQLEKKIEFLLSKNRSTKKKNRSIISVV